METKPDPAAVAAAAAAAAKIKELKNAEAELMRDLKAQLKYIPPQESLRIPKNPLNICLK